jgi:hypothetical protein
MHARRYNSNFYCYIKGQGQGTVRAGSPRSNVSLASPQLPAALAFIAASVEEGRGAPAGGTARSASLTVAPDACAVQCTQCNGVTRIRRSSSLVVRPPAPVSFPCTRGKKRRPDRHHLRRHAAGLRPAERPHQRRQVHEADPLPALRLPQRMHPHPHRYVISFLSYCRRDH